MNNNKEIVIMDMKARWAVKLNICLGEAGRRFWTSMTGSGIPVHEHPSVNISRRVMNVLVEEKEDYSI